MALRADTHQDHLADLSGPPALLVDERKVQVEFGGEAGAPGEGTVQHLKTRRLEHLLAPPMSGLTRTASSQSGS
jgi:hypothetical protein